MHGVRALVTRYLPRSSRAGVGSKRRSVSGRARGPMNGRIPTTAGSPTTTRTNKTRPIHLIVLRMSWLDSSSRSEERRVGKEGGSTPERNHLKQTVILE